MMEDAAQNLASLVDQHGIQALVGNLETEVFTLSVGDWTIPVSRNDGLRRTCYINSPSRAFLDYGAEELDRLTANPLARIGGRGLLATMNPIVKATGLDRQIQLNNWLVATNILPPASAEEWLRLFDSVSANEGDFIPVLRSVNQTAHSGLLAAFEAADLTLFPLRKVFLRDYAVAQEWTSDEAKDAKLLSDQRFEQRGGDTFSKAEFGRAAELYGQLYLEKYSRLNPHYSATFLEVAQMRLGLRLDGLFDTSGEMVGVIGRYQQHGTLTGPIVGYDTGLPAKLGLYRRLRAINHGVARRGNHLYNMSAGAEGFKKLRGGRATIEYMVADFRRAKSSQRRAAKVLSGLCQWAAKQMIA
ncbi:MAG: hypothetical protein ACPG40_01955 [Alphaproteobacteria bacterium]